MRASVVGILMIVMASFLPVAHADMNPNESQSDLNEVFGNLSKEKAKAKAQEMAEKDFAKNSFRIFVAGMRRQQDVHDNYLKEKYGVMVTPIAGCVVSEGIMGAIEGYNLTMKPLLNRKFGHDIFKEAEEAARR